MNVRKFIAATARDALRKVKETLGPDAIILSNRAIPGGVEIMAVAAQDMAMIVPTPVRDVSSVSDDYTVKLSAPAQAAAAKVREREAAREAQTAPARPRASSRQGMGETFAKSLLRTVATQAGREIMRGLLGGLRRR